MAKQPSKPERITPPAKKAVKKAAQGLPRGGAKAILPGRVLVEEKVAKKQGARRGRA